MKQRKESKIMTTFYRAHPWHGIEPGENSPNVVSCYIEIVPTDTIKYELDKTTGLLKIDRPQKYSNYCPALYGLIPQTYCGKRVGDYCSRKTNRPNILGDEDPLDICVLAEKPILRSDILLKAIPIGGFRSIDKGQADDKIIAVLEGDLVYGHIRDIEDCPVHLIERLHHYFITYKSRPGPNHATTLEILATYGREVAHEVIALAQKDYQEEFHDIYATYKQLMKKN